MEKKCLVHGLVKFSYNKQRGGYYCPRCYAAKQKRESRSILKKNAIKYKGGKCAICGYKKNNNALEFHHIDSSQKEFSISRHAVGKRWKKIREELDKCILLCSNCHREIHSKS